MAESALDACTVHGCVRQRTTVPTAVFTGTQSHYVAVSPSKPGEKSLKRSNTAGTCA